MEHECDEDSAGGWKTPPDSSYPVAFPHKLHVTQCEVGVNGTMTSF